MPLRHKLLPHGEFHLALVLNGQTTCEMRVLLSSASQVHKARLAVRNCRALSTFGQSQALQRIWQTACPETFVDTSS